MKTILSMAALCLAAGGAYAQDKEKPKKDEGQDPVLKEVDKRLKAQGDEVLRAVEKLLDDRLGKPERRQEEKKNIPSKKESQEGKGDDRASILKEVDRRLNIQREELLKGVEKLLDARLGKSSKGDPEKGEPGKKRHRLPPGLAMQRGHLPPGLAGKQRLDKHGHAKKPGKAGMKRDEDPRKGEKGKEEDDRND